tara:strand:- start:5237 stop:5692 length:456 start_codon:yes stop_codon:yes gene_type:complete
MKLSFAKVLFIYFVKDKKKYFMKKFIYISILFCLTAIILGALGAHLLKEILSENKLTSFETGIRYQMFHGLTILILSLNKDYFTNRLNVILKIMSFGTVLFSLSIYLLSLQGLIEFKLSFLGPITPIGGLFLIISWILLFCNVKKNSSTLN